MSDDTGEKGVSGGGERQEMRTIVQDHKIFWTTMPIDIPVGEQGLVRAGVTVALAGTEAEGQPPKNESAKAATFDCLNRLAKWLISEPRQGVRFDIRRHYNVVFFLPDDLRTNRNNYVISIRILHSEQFDTPIGAAQIEAFQDLQKKLKDIGSPKEHWKEHYTTL
ncbi:MAG: hypothetical protein IT344_07185 [Candidatus Dadabacteria bacterium]|nr:hypothetical protein [Candidatus Dadabacteria bacterium]